MYEPSEPRFSPENMHQGTMRDQVLERMMASDSALGNPPAHASATVPPSSSEERVVREARHEVRDDQRVVESAVAEQEASNRDFGGLLFGLGSQGVELMVELPDRQLVGTIVHVGAELITIENLGGERFDVALDALGGLRATGGQPRPGAVSTGHPNTVVARLREALTAGENVTISRRFGSPMGGQIQGVSEAHAQGLDHNGSYWFLPLGMVAWIATI